MSSTNEYFKKSTDLNQLLPVRNRDKTLSSIIKNLFNRFLTKNESATIFGYVGSKDPIQDSNDVYITEPTLERQINTLIPTVYTKHATTEHVMTWNDVLQKLQLLGVDIHNIDSWATLRQFNFVPPIDIDKFCNFDEYFWLGPWVKTALRNIKNDWSVISPTTSGLENNILSFQVIDVNYVDVSVDEVWTVQILSGNQVLVTGSSVGFDVQTTLSTTGDTILNGLRTSIILRSGIYTPGDTITIRMTRLNNPYVAVFTDILKIDNILKVEKIFKDTNPGYLTEYYTIKKPNNNFDSWNDWSKINLWVHREDVIQFLIDNPFVDLTIESISQSIRPIIEYNYDVQLNGKISSTGPVDLDSSEGTSYTQTKKKRNQVPLFDIFYSNGKHARKVSPIFYYAEGNNFEIDSELLRRLEVTDSSDFIFEHGLYDSTKDELLFYKNTLGELKTIWIPGAQVAPDYLKTDITGTIINIDKFNNYSNYYWTGHLLESSAFPAYYMDKAGQPEYTCIEKTGDITDNDWQSTNHWVHINQLDKNSLSNYIPAVKPIIEFNSRLVPSLLSNVKTSFDEKPKFKLYEFNDATNEYDLLTTSIVNPFKDDIIASNYLIILNEELTEQQKLGNEQTYEIYTESMFLFEDKQFVQSLKNFYFETQYYDGQPFKYFGTAVGGGISDIKIVSTLGLQSWTLKYSIDQSLIAGYPVFEVYGSKTGLEETFAHQGVTYNNGKVMFKVNTASYIQSDSLLFQFNSSLKFIQKNFVKLKVDLTITTGSIEDIYNYVYKSIDEAIDIIKTEKTVSLVPGNQEVQDGVFKTPAAFEFNVNNEDRTKINQGDLVFHFASIIKAQEGLVGQPLSSNNFRNLVSPDVGLGGLIKQFNSSLNLFLGVMNQQGITPLSLIEFAKNQYANLHNQAIDYALNSAIDRISDGTLTVSSSTWDDDLFKYFKEDYLIKQNSVVINSSSIVDDNIARVFYDTTSPIPNTILTLPQLGLCQKIYPNISLDEELGILMLTCHDGHKIKLYNYNIELIKKYVTKNYLRSNGTYSPGHISAKTPISRPYKNQFWFDTSTNELLYYNVVSDTGELPTDGIEIGRFSYNRSSNTLYEFDGISWNSTGAINDPWTVIPNIVDDLILRIEYEFYNRIHPTSTKVNIPALIASSQYDALMQTQFNDFGIKYKINDIYDTSYNPNNAFTWNYSDVLPFATWQENYKSLYGTSRPDLYPWKIVNETESDFITNIGGANNLFTSTMWLYVKSIYTLPISVDLITNKLLPPYVTIGNPASVEALLTTVPNGIANKVEFGDNGLIELVWKKSIEFNYDRAKVFFKIDPINFVNDTWGYNDISIGGFEINRIKSKKLSQLYFVLHNERKSITHQYGDIFVTVASSFVPETYIVEVINRKDSYFRVTRSSDGAEFFHEFNSNFVDSNIDALTINDFNYYQGLSQGDKWIVTITDSLMPTITFIANPNYSFTGFNQIYVQYLRLLASNIDTTLNVSLLRNWDVRLGYRVSGFIDNNLTTIKTDTYNLDSSDWLTIIKENKLINDLWVHALRIQLVQKGSTTIRDDKQIPALAPGDEEYLTGKDWIFRVETFNNVKSKIDFYQYDLNGEVETFTALNQQNSLETWLRYKTITNTRSEYAPFLVQGIQNLITFLIGYSQKLNDIGWIPYDPEDPVVDTKTGRVLDWQFEIESLINMLFAGNIKAGIGYILNPFKNSIWIDTPRGQIADLNARSKLDYETTQSIVNISGQEINSSNIRVFRDNNKTEIVSNEPMYSLHLTVSEYEHLILFNNYASNINLIYDPFLGQKVYRFHIIGQKQVSFLGRPSFGGRFLIDNKMYQNLESSVEGILNFYDSNKMLAKTPETDHARALLGYTEQKYFSDIGLTDHSAFRFWQGMISNKGSNFSLDAFSNQLKYRNVQLDEFWAYKIAEYGDVGKIFNPEIKMYLNDISNQYAHYKFLESTDSEFDYGYDIFPYDHGGFGGGNAFIEQDDIFAYVSIRPDDEKYWFSIDDLGTHEYFEAQLNDEIYIQPTSIDRLYQLINNVGKVVYADVIEIVTPYEPDTGSGIIEERTYREYGDYSNLTEEFTEPAFTRINSTFIKFNDINLLNKVIKIKCYTRPTKAYGPLKLIDYKNNIIVRDDIILWDPARGIHNYRAMENIDIMTTEDPARYNSSIYTAGNLQYEPLRPWEENKVGKIWWDTTLLAWKPYYDTKIYRSVLDRIYAWGALSDYSRVKIYQWIESPVPPSEYEAYVESQSQQPTSDFYPFRHSGKPLKRMYQRTRSWQHRTVAWKYSDNVCNSTRKFITGTNERIIISTVGVGPANGYLTFGRLSSLGISEGYKFCNAIWTTTEKLTDTTAEVGKVFGESLILEKPEYVVGSGCIMEDGGIYEASDYFTNINVTVDNLALSEYLTDVDGQIIFDKEYDSDTGYYFLKATIQKNNRSQRILVVDTPVKSGTTFSYRFDDLGITISATTVGDHGDTGLESAQDRINKVALDLGNTLHDVFIRQKFKIFNLVPYKYYYTNSTTGITEYIETDQLYSMEDVVEMSWVAWIDPENLDNDDIEPMNKWEPVLGENIDIGPDLQTVTSYIKSEKTILESAIRLHKYKKYSYIWNDWMQSRDYLIPRNYYYLTEGLTRQEFFENSLQVPLGTGLDSDLLSITNKEKQLEVYVNRKRINDNHWDIKYHPNGYSKYIYLDNSVYLRSGDWIEVQIKMYEPNQEELEFDPDVNPEKDDPMKLYQFKYDYPFTKKDQFTEYGYKGTPKYYFWATDIKSKMSGKKLSTSVITNLLVNNPDPYAIIQGLRYYNPITERPNRFSLMTVKNLNQIVTSENVYKLRLTTDFSLREKNNNLDLKNVHTEWIKIREQQSTRIPRTLWDAIINSMCAKNAIGEDLPSYKRELYDRTHGTTNRYGFGPDQVIGDKDIIINTVTHIILNTKLHKYINPVDFISDTIDFSNFGNDSTGSTYDISKLDLYVSNEDEIRKLMENIWTHAKPKQINEIFFATLNDALSFNKELKDLFKTSIVAMQTTRIISTDQNTGQFINVTG